jgi:pimeloyl-ACP methyl ester carboxylesterase
MLRLVSRARLVGHDWVGALAFDWAARHAVRLRSVHADAARHTIRSPSCVEVLDVSGGRCVRRQAVDQLLGRIQSRGDQVVAVLPEHCADQRYVAAVGATGTGT